MKPRNKIGAAFGSHGWGGESVRQICDTFDELKINRIDDGLRIVFVPDENQLQECREYGHKIAAAIEEQEAKAAVAA